jgi:hypothetical protein
MMRFLQVAFAMFLVSNLYGDVSIDKQIAEIMKAPKEKRMELMNNLKTKLSEMNEEQRSAALQKLQKNIASGMNSGSAMQSQFSPKPMQQGNPGGMGSHSLPNFKNK